MFGCKLEKMPRNSNSNTGAYPHFTQMAAHFDCVTRCQQKVGSKLKSLIERKRLPEGEKLLPETGGPSHGGTWQRKRLNTTVNSKIQMAAQNVHREGTSSNTQTAKKGDGQPGGSTHLPSQGPRTRRQVLGAAAAGIHTNADHHVHQRARAPGASGEFPLATPHVHNAAYNLKVGYVRVREAERRISGKPGAPPTHKHFHRHFALRVTRWNFHKTRITRNNTEKHD